MPNLAANPQLLIYGIAGLAAIAMLLLGFGIYAAVTAPQARLKRRISSVVGDPLPALVLPGTGRKDPDAAGKRKKQIQERLKHAEESRQKRRGSRLRESLVFAGLKISPQQFILYALLGGAILMGIAFYFGVPPILLPAVGLVAFLGIPKFILNYLIKKRLKKFIAAFPDAIDIIVRGVRSGLTVGLWQREDLPYRTVMWTGRSDSMCVSPHSSAAVRWLR